MIVVLLNQFTSLLWGRVDMTETPKLLKYSADSGGHYRSSRKGINILGGEPTNVQHCSCHTDSFTSSSQTILFGMICLARHMLSLLSTTNLQCPPIHNLSATEMYIALADSRADVPSVHREQMVTRISSLASKWCHKQGAWSTGKRSTSHGNTARISSSASV